MSILKQVATIFGICLLGEVVSAILPFPFPAAIAAMILLLAALSTGIVKMEAVDGASSFLLKNMAFFFIPAGVAVIEHFEMIGAIWLPVLALIVISTAIVFLLSAATVVLVLKLEKRRKAR